MGHEPQTPEEEPPGPTCSTITHEVTMSLQVPYAAPVGKALLYSAVEHIGAAVHACMDGMLTMATSRAPVEPEEDPAPQRVQTVAPASHRGTAFMGDLAYQDSQPYHSRILSTGVRFFADGSCKGHRSCMPRHKL